MKKYMLTALSIITIFTLVGCDDNKVDKVIENEHVNIEEAEIGVELSTIKGFVTQIEEERILVIAEQPTEDDFYNAIWFSNVPKEIKIGQKVEVSYGLMLTSYPGQSDAKSVVVLKTDKPEQADLTQEQAINKALKMKKKELGEFPTAIKSVFYEEEIDSWTVLMKQEESEHSATVKDQ